MIVLAISCFVTTRPSDCPKKERSDGAEARHGLSLPWLILSLSANPPAYSSGTSFGFYRRPPTRGFIRPARFSDSYWCQPTVLPASLYPALNTASIFAFVQGKKERGASEPQLRIASFTANFSVARRLSGTFVRQ